MAEKLNAGFIPIRKAGKLPFQTIREEYVLEYGTDTLHMHRAVLFFLMDMKFLNGKEKLGPYEVVSLFTY